MDYKMPTGWSKGEPLTVQKISETCYRLIRSGRYLAVPDAPHVSGSVPYMEFRSRVEMVEWQQWWDNPESTPFVSRELTPAEYLEYVQEMLEFHPRHGAVEHLLPGTPNDCHLFVRVPEDQAVQLRAAHSKYCLAVAKILYPNKRGDGGDEPS